MTKLLFLWRLYLVWRRMPQLRFCQLFCDTMGASHPIFYLSDAKAAQRLRDFEQRYL